MLDALAAPSNGFCTQEFAAMMNAAENTPVHGERHMSTGYEYKVVQVREGLIGGKMSGDKLERILNDHASNGWQLKAITAVEVKGRIGPGGVEGVLVTFERPRG
ncbi:MAG TPA: DUF4177 domain-containing protein [Microbacterium sp.]|nr:DUF4177 domain-containing protein [Microbacterium sp.]